MSINYTATSPLTARITTTDKYTKALEEEEVTVLAFGWADAQPEQTTGVWVLGAGIGGVTFIPARAILSLEPCTSKLQHAIERTEAIAVHARELANELQVKVDRAMREADVAESVAVGAMEVAIETAEEVEERDEADAEAAAEAAALADQRGNRPRGASHKDGVAPTRSRAARSTAQPSRAARSTASRSSSSKPATRSSARPGAKGKPVEKVR